MNSLGPGISLFGFICWKEEELGRLSVVCWEQQSKGGWGTEQGKGIPAKSLFVEGAHTVPFVYLWPFSRGRAGRTWKGVCNKAPLRRKEMGCRIMRFCIWRLTEILISRVWVFWNAMVMLAKARILCSWFSLVGLHRSLAHFLPSCLWPFYKFQKWI